MNSIPKATLLSDFHISFKHDFPKLFIIALVYFLAHGIAFFFPDSEKIIMLVWPAGGVGLAAFLLNPKRLWPALIVAFYISGITADVFLAGRSIIAGVGYMTANMVESIGCTWLIIHVCKDFQRFSRVKEVLALIAGTIFVNAFSSCIGAGTSVLTSGAHFELAWQSWYVSDGLGVLLIGPFIISWINSEKKFLIKFQPKKIIEVTAFLIIWSAICYLIFYNNQIKDVLGFHPYILVAILSWPALRFGQRGVTLSLMLLFTIAIFSPAIANGPSPWDGLDAIPAHRVLELQLFLAFMAVVGYVMASGYTSLTQAENSLISKSEHLDFALKSSGAGLWDWDMTTGHLTWSPELHQLFGVEADVTPTFEVWRKVLHPDDLQLAEDRINDAIRNQSALSSEYRIILPNGETCWIQALGQAIYDERGEAKRMSGICINIHDRKQAEESIRESDLRFKFHIDNSPLASIEWDSNFLVTRWAGSAERIFGWTEKEVIGKPIMDLKMIHEDDIPIVENTMKLLTNRISQQVSSANRNYTKDRKIIYCEWYNSILHDSQGNMVSIMSQVLDNTERKQLEERLKENEERFRILFEQAPLGYQSLDENGFFVVVNQAWLDILGYEQEEVIGKWFGDFLAPEYRDAFRTRFPLFKAAGKIHSEFEMVHKNGSRLYIAFEGRIGYKIDGDFKQTHCILSDITEQRKNELALKESEKRFRELFDYTPISYQSLNESGIFLDVNAEWLQLMGYSREEVIGMSFGDFWSDETKDQFTAKFEQFKKHGIIKDAELVLTKHNGNNITVILTGKVQYDNEGNVEKTHCIIVDISKRKLLEVHLKESEAQQRLILNNINEVVYSTSQLEPNSPEGIPIFVSSRSEKLLGIESHEFMAYPNLWFSLIHHEDQDVVYRKTIEIFATQKPGIRVYRILNKKTGEYIWVEDYVVPDLNEFGKVIGTFGVARDITERKTSEVALQQTHELLVNLSDQVPGVVYQYRLYPDGRSCFPFSSVGMNMIYECTPEEVREDATPVFGRLHPEDYDHVANLIQESARTLELFHCEFRVILPKQGLRWRISNARPERMPDGGTLWYGIISDFTDYKLAQAELELHRNHLEEMVKLRSEEWNNANEELKTQLEKQKEFELLLQQSLEKEKELNEMKSRFISTTSHEFRTPLTSAQLSVELLQRYMTKWDEAKKNEHFERIKHSVTYLTKLLDDVLTISRTESGKISYNPEQLDLEEFAIGCVNEARSLSNKHEIKLSFKASISHYLLDPKLMKFVFNNLLSNAIKYSPEGGEVALTISTHEKKLIIVVTDKGIGIPADEIKNIFDSFYRTKNAGDIAGTGLGLAIVKSAVDLHKGEITVTSELRKGTTFTVKIPQA